MAGAENSLERFRPQLTALDDEALAVATSKGLVRRAQKDLQKGVEPKLLNSADSLILEVDRHTVSLPPTGLLDAHCTCPAADICRHRLAAYLWLRSQLQPCNPPSNAPPSPSEISTPPLPVYSLADLIAWASKPVVREALTFLDQKPPQIESVDPIVVRFTQANITCRYFAATGLDGMLCSCKARRVCLHQVATVLAVLRSQGIVLALPASSPSAESETAATTAAAQVIATAQTLLEKTIAVGLLHLSEISRQQFVTLAVSAQGAKLPRLALALRSIASNIDLSLKRDAAADSDRLFGRLAHTYALCAALQQTAPAYPPYLAGRSQSHYEDVGSLELIGMGAYPWQTQSGYGGLTVLFWDKAAQQWCSWSESRPLFHGNGFKPARAYRQPGPWEGIAHPAEASQSCLRLYNARRNYQQRLSTSSQTIGVTLRPTQPADWQSVSCCFQDWQALHQHMARAWPMGLAESAPLERLAVIQPHQWGPRQFDPVQQCFTWDLLDQADRLLLLKIPFTSTDSAALEQLEQLDPAKASVSGVIGAISLAREAIYCQPIALCRQSDPGRSAIINLHFPPEQRASKPAIASQPLTESKEADLDALTSARGATTPSVDLLLAALQRLAERGQNALDQAALRALTQQANYSETVGMATLADATRRLVESPGHLSSQLLKIRYLCYLYQQT